MNKYKVIILILSAIVLVLITGIVTHHYTLKNSVENTIIDNPQTSTDNSQVQSEEGFSQSLNIDSRICGKWQSQSNPGLSAFVFYENRTYDSYISTNYFSGQYEIYGDRLILKEYDSNKQIIYYFSVTEEELTLSRSEENGKNLELSDVSKYDRVDELNQKSLMDIIGELKDDAEATTEDE